MAAAKRTKKPTFEEAVAELEETVARLERDDITLDESLILYTRGIELTAICNGIVKDIEGKIVKLVEDGGEIREEAFDDT